MDSSYSSPTRASPSRGAAGGSTLLGDARLACPILSGESTESFEDDDVDAPLPPCDEAASVGAADAAAAAVAAGCEVAGDGCRHAGCCALVPGCSCWPPVLLRRAVCVGGALQNPPPLPLPPPSLLGSLRPLSLVRLRWALDTLAALAWGCMGAGMGTAAQGAAARDM
jgi:hypothetical protein